jgi:hypothetical protein
MSHPVPVLYQGRSFPPLLVRVAPSCKEGVLYSISPAGVVRVIAEAKASDGKAVALRQVTLQASWSFTSCPQQYDGYLGCSTAGSVN